MSLSDAHSAPSSQSPAQPQDQQRWGTVFMGPDSTRESRLDKILNQQERELWNQSTEIEYLGRVREKAAAEAASIAKAILDKAQADGDALRREINAWGMEFKTRTEETHILAKQELDKAQALRLEAEKFRNQAEAEGWQAGFDAARQEALEHEARRDAAASALLHRIQEQCGVMFAAWRDELAALARQAVQTATGWVMSEEHAQGLAQLLDRAVQALENHQDFTIHVHPEDEELARNLLGKAQDSLGLNRWTVLADPDIEAGGLRLESDASKVEDYPALRRAVVEEALARLGLPPDCAEDAYKAARARLPELAQLPAPADPVTANTATTAAHSEQQTIPPEMKKTAKLPELSAPEPMPAAPEAKAQELPKFPELPTVPEIQEIPELAEAAPAKAAPAPEADLAAASPDTSADATDNLLPDIIPETEETACAAPADAPAHAEAPAAQEESAQPPVSETLPEPAPEKEESAPLPAPGPADDDKANSLSSKLAAAGHAPMGAFAPLGGMDDFGSSGGLSDLKEIKF